MHAINIIPSASSNSLEVCSRSVPDPHPGEVLIKVHAAGVNRPDIMQRKGLYPPPEGTSDILGLEVSGTIAALGSNTMHLNIGDKVCALVTGGGYAEYCTAPAQLCLAIPESFSFVQAAALPETYFTVWSNLFDRAQLQAAETLFVHMCGSGVTACHNLLAMEIAGLTGSKLYAGSWSEWIRNKNHALSVQYKTK